MQYSCMPFDIRTATLHDVPTLEALIDRSVRGLQRHDYTAAEIDIALATVYGVDSQLIRDETYFVVEARADTGAPGAPTASQPGVIVACGGWSKRRTLFGGDHYADRPAAELDPSHDAAKIRAFFVDPDWARRGIGSLLLEACERAAFAAGFTRLEMGATLTGVPFYRARGYVERDHITVALSAGESLAIVRMEKARSSLPARPAPGDSPR
jgi:GNAT superfamily N-acetyltransferase